MESKKYPLILCKLMQGISVFSIQNVPTISNYNLTKRLQKMTAVFKKGYQT